MIFSYDIPHDDQPNGIVMYDDLKIKMYSIYYGVLLYLWGPCAREGEIMLSGMFVNTI
jgi:hypothetical protein